MLKEFGFWSQTVMMYVLSAYSVGQGPLPHTGVTDYGILGKFFLL